MSKLPLAIKIENVVATGALKHRIDLGMLTRAFPQAEYIPKKFAAVIFRKRSMKSATFDRSIVRVFFWLHTISPVSLSLKRTFQVIMNNLESSREQL